MQVSYHALREQLILRGTSSAPAGRALKSRRAAASYRADRARAPAKPPQNKLPTEHFLLHRVLAVAGAAEGAVLEIDDDGCVFDIAFALYALDDFFAGERTRFALKY